MRLQTLLLLLVLCAGPAASQNASFPLESVTIEGSSISQPVILEIAGLHLATPVDKRGIEQACTRLQDSGVFASISYRYAPGPKKGYALTLTLTDQAPWLPPQSMCLVRTKKKPGGGYPRGFGGSTTKCRRWKPRKVFLP